MKILVLNCGSSSIKYQLVDMANNAQVMAKGLLERIGLEMGEFTHKYNGQKHYEQLPIADHTAGIKIVLNALVDPTMGVIKDFKEIGAVGNRIAHGGETFDKSVVVTDEVIEKVKSLTHLAPLHTPGNLAGIYAMREVLPGVPQVAVFDTAFHSTLPAKSYLYAIPYEYYQKYGVRRYGFHGTSHKFVAGRACEMTGTDINDSKIITCHLGNGGSVTAILNGKSVDTSMGFTPTDGVEMGTRSGCIDPGAVLYLQEKEVLDAAEMTKVLNKKSGFAGLSGVSSDNRDIQTEAEKGNARAILTKEVFYYGVRKFIGAYSAAMGGVDMIVFTGGIGENDRNVRREICKTLGYLGVDFDDEANDRVHGEDAIITKPGSKVKVLMICTNEELVIARDTMALSE